MIAPRLTCLAGALITLLGVACSDDPRTGYSSNSVFRTDVSTIAVELFGNDTYERELGPQLTGAIVRELQVKTPWRIATPMMADTVIQGRITSVDLESLSASLTTGLSQEMAVSIAIDFTWSDRRTGQPLVVRKQFSASGVFIPSQPASEPIDLGQMQALQQLAADLVDELRAGW